MKYFETIHERNAAKITALITAIIILLLFVMGYTYLDPPEEYGVAVNFGNASVGSGAIQPTQPVKSEPREVVEPPKEVPTQSQPEATTPKTNAEDVLTEESEESIALKKQKEAEAKAKAEAERVAQEKREAAERKRLEEERKKKALDALIGGVSKSEGNQIGSEGNDTKAGDKGQLDGDPYAPSYFGGAGPGKGGVGFGLNGRGSPTRHIFKQDCNEYGLVVVKIEVDRNGRVVKAEPGVKGTTNTAPCLLEPAKKIALSHKWPADSNAPSRQVGFVSVNFDLSN